MKGRFTRDRRWGVSIVELLAVTAVIALLLTMGFTLHKGMSLAARASVAESNLRQVSVSLELYFRKYGSYPPQGCDLAEALAPFVDNPEVFCNPLMAESKPGKTLSDLYKEPTLDELDSPNHYLTALVADNGTTAVVLRTGSMVQRRDDLCFDPRHPGIGLLVLLDSDRNPQAPSDDPTSPPTVTPTDPTPTPVIGTRVTYVVVRDAANKIKYEGAADGLGEDGAKETDQFLITVYAAGDEVTVQAKASVKTVKNTIKLGDDATTAQKAIADEFLGFTVKLTGKVKVPAADDDKTHAYTFAVSSITNRHALSYIEFTFGAGALIRGGGSAYDAFRTPQ